MNGDQWLHAIKYIVIGVTIIGVIVGLAWSERKGSTDAVRHFSDQRDSARQTAANLEAEIAAHRDYLRRMVHDAESTQAREAFALALAEMNHYPHQDEK